MLTIAFNDLIGIDCTPIIFSSGGFMPAGGGFHAAIRHMPLPAGAGAGGAFPRPAGMGGGGGGSIFLRHGEPPMRFQKTVNGLEFLHAAQSK